MSTREKPLRILLSAYACEPGRGSEPGVGWNWAKALSRRGHQVWVLTRANNRKPIEEAVAGLTEKERAHLQFIYYDLPGWAAWWKKGGRGVHFYYELWQRNILRVAADAHSAHNFDVVHHLTFGVWRQATQLYKLGIPVIFGPVGGGESAPAGLVRGLPFAARALEWLRHLANHFASLDPGLRTCLRETRWVIAKTKETATWLKRAGADSSTSFEIGIDVPRLQFRNERSTDRSLNCLYAGRLLGWKGIHLAIEAVAAARARAGAVSLTVVGKGPMRERLDKLARQLGVSEHVRFIEWLDQGELFEQYCKHDVLLFPSLHDSSGNVILEGFAHALPAVCLNLGGPGALVDSSNGIVVEPSGNPVAGLASALLQLAEHPELRTDLGFNARARALRSSWDRIVENVYRPVEMALSP